MEKLVKKNSKGIIQFIKFNAVGVVNTLIDFGVLALLNKYFGIYYMYAKVCSYSCGTLNSYIMNKNWTFKAKTKVSTSEVAKFIIVNLSSLGISLILMNIFVEYIGLGTIFSNIFATGGSLIVNYLGNKIWVFKN